MTLTDVAWVRDHQHRSVLRLSIDGHPAHIRSAQQLERTRRGIVTGIDFFASEWRRERADQAFICGEVEPGLGAAGLAGSTDDPQVFALYEEMCRAIRAGTWQPGPRSLPADSGKPNRARSTPSEGRPGNNETDHGS